MATALEESIESARNWMHPAPDDVLPRALTVIYLGTLAVVALSGMPLEQAAVTVGYLWGVYTVAAAVG